MKKYTNIQKYLEIILKCIVNCEKNYNESNATQFAPGSKFCLEDCCQDALSVVDYSCRRIQQSNGVRNRFDYVQRFVMS